MADEDPEERRHPPAFKQQLTKDMMNATGMLQEQAKSFLKTYDWNFEAALHGYQQRLLEPGARARGLPPALVLAAREAEAAARGEHQGGKKSRKRRTKKSRTTGGKKSRRRLKKRTTLKGGKRKRRRTRRRR